MASNKKILANRKNSLKSTGPKTREGKLRTSKNAIQHGLDAEKFVVIGEKINDLIEFRDRLIDHLKPQGIQEEIIVSKIIDGAIRLRRIPIIEAGIFNHEMLEYEAKENKDRVAHAIEGIGDKKAAAIHEAWLEQKQLIAEKTQKLNASRKKMLKQELEWVRMNASSRLTKNKARLKRYDELANQEFDTAVSAAGAEEKDDDDE